MGKEGSDAAALVTTAFGGAKGDIWDCALVLSTAGETTRELVMGEMDSSRGGWFAMALESLDDYLRSGARNSAPRVASR